MFSIEEDMYELWAIKWLFSGQVSGISFHNSPRAAVKFYEQQSNIEENREMQLVPVSESLYQQVQDTGFCFLNIETFEQATETYKCYTPATH